MAQALFIVLALLLPHDTIHGSVHTGILSNLFFWLRVGLGLGFPAVLGWMAYDSSGVRAMQSATGLLYIAMVLVICGEVVANGLLFVTAIEPDPYMLQRAQERAANAAANIDLRQAAAEQLPFPDAAFDFVIATLVLCSVSDPRKVLSEIYGVLRPGGEYRLYEHVRYQNPIGGLMQDAVSPVWQWFGAGCHPNRDTGRLVREAGFEVVSAQRLTHVPPVPPMIFVRPNLRAVARRPI